MELDKVALDRWITGNYGEDQFADAEFEIEWQNDWSVDHQKEFDCYENGGPETCQRCVVYGPDDGVWAALGCIDDATDEYRREIERELLEEAREAWANR